MLFRSLGLADRRRERKQPDGAGLLPHCGFGLLCDVAQAKRLRLPDPLAGMRQERSCARCLRPVPEADMGKSPDSGAGRTLRGWKPGDGPVSAKICGCSRLTVLLEHIVFTWAGTAELAGGFADDYPEQCLLLAA